MLAAALSLLGWGLDVLGRLEDDAVDLRFEVRGERSAPDDLAVVGVDDASQAELRQRWPFPRRLQARLVDRLRAAGPRLIVYDVEIADASEDLAGDERLVSAVGRARPVLLGTSTFDPDGTTEVFGGERTRRSVGAEVASALFESDGDGTIRRLQAATAALPTLAARATQLAGVRAARFPDPAWIDFAGPEGTIATHSFSDVLRGRVPAAALRDRIVVVGVTASALGDVHPTSAPGAGRLPGAEIQANAIDTVLRGFPLRSASGAVDAALVALLAALVPLIAARFALRALLVGPAVAALYLVAAQIAFDGGTILPVAHPLAGLIVGSGGAAGTLAATELRERRRVRAAFARFVPPEIVDDVIEHADLEGVELDATVMFCDLRGFTTFAEHRTAREVIQTLNRYLTEVSDAVLEAQGTVVAYLGDGVMSVFGAPLAADDHADRALAAARAIAGPRLDRLNAALAEHGVHERFRIGIGLNSGTVMSGTVGSQRRMEYAAVGDTTNVAARLQGLTKEHGVPILLSQSTHERLCDRTGLTEIGEVAVRGRAGAQRLFATIEDPRE